MEMNTVKFTRAEIGSGFSRTKQKGKKEIKKSTGKGEGLEGLLSGPKQVRFVTGPIFRLKYHVILLIMFIEK